ncbi:bifunctional riboflavin kinase/FAD synthetase [candidate division KSB1 bacterium]
MELINNLDDYRKKSDSVITVGTFDGIHIGHAAILKRVIDYSKENNLTSTIVTFYPHPRLVVKQKNGRAVKLIYTIDEKIEVLREYEIDRLLVIPFTREFSQTSPESFVSEILCKKLGLKCLIIGHDHGFGKNREGSIEFLKKFEKECKFDIFVQEPITNDLGVISSSLIRDLLENGDIKKANRCLNRPFFITGQVIHGDKRGRILNYPTANIKIENKDKCIPGNGVYVVKIDIEGDSHFGVMNIGVRPTFDKSEKTLEIHILDFSQEIYGTELKVSFLDKLRDEKKFNSADILKSQIDSDIVDAMNIIKNC